MLTITNSLERKINKLMELKTQHKNFTKHTQVSIAKLTKQKKGSEVEDQLNEIKRETNIREKCTKRNEQNLQEMWDYGKRPNLCLIGVPECDEENESKLENTLQDIIQENFSTQQGRKYREHQKDIPQEEQPQGT